MLFSSRYIDRNQTGKPAGKQYKQGSIKPSIFECLKTVINDQSKKYSHLIILVIFQQLFLVADPKFNLK